MVEFDFKHPERTTRHDLAMENIKNSSNFKLNMWVMAVCFGVPVIILILEKLYGR